MESADLDELKKHPPFTEEAMRKIEEALSNMQESLDRIYETVNRLPDHLS